MADIKATIEDNVLILAFTNGKAVQISAKSVVEEIRNIAILHGLKQKLVDAAAIGCDPATGKPATIDAKWDAVKRVYDRITDPDDPSWNERRAGSAQPRTGLLVAALCRLYPARTPEQLREFVAKLQPGDVTNLRRTPKVADMIEIIRAERPKSATGTSNAEDLLAQLEL